MAKEATKTAKDMFIEEIESLINSALDCQEIPFEGLSPQAQDYFNNTIKAPGRRKEKVEITESGKNILIYMYEYAREHEEDETLTFRSKDIAEALFVSGRSIAGAMRKLVADGYVEKETDSEPVRYSLSRSGIGKAMNLVEENK